MPQQTDGPLVVRRRRRGRPPAAVLSRSGITAAAMALVDAHGPRSLTMSALADRLGVAPSALYNHVATKDELLGWLQDHVNAHVDVSSFAEQPWRDAVALWARSYRGAYAQHPALVPLIATARVAGAPHTVAMYEHVAAGLTAGGWPQDLVADAVVALESFVLGSALDVSAPGDIFEPGDLEPVAPALSAASAARTADDPALAAFELGLAAMVDGLASRVERETSARGRCGGLAGRSSFDGTPERWQGGGVTDATNGPTEPIDSLTDPADIDHAGLWAAAQQRVLELVESVDEQAMTSAHLPATPAWSPRELLAHVVGVAADALAGTTDANVSESWTQGHVDERADKTLSEVLDEWRGLTDRVLAFIPDAPLPTRTSLVVDLTTHEQDLRGGLDRPGARTDPALDVGVLAFGGAFAGKVADRGLEPVRLVGDHLEVVAPQGSHPVVEAQATTFELHRALSGRRSAAQVRALDWTGDPEPYLSIFSRFGDLHESDIVE